jgi:hypothetical protein
MKMATFIVSWEEYRECWTTVEAESRDEAEEKFYKGKHGRVGASVESCDNLEINEIDENEKVHC